MRDGQTDRELPAENLLRLAIDVRDGAVAAAGDDHAHGQMVERLAKRFLARALAVGPPVLQKGDSRLHV